MSTRWLLMTKVNTSIEKYGGKVVSQVQVLQVKKFDFEEWCSDPSWTKCVLVKYQITKNNKYPFEGSVRVFQWYRWFVKLSYGLAAAGERKIRGFSFNKAFSLQIHSFSSEDVANVEMREGPKSCSDRSKQNDHWN